ncbi:MAG TPA: flagellar hook-basal body complex protein FliE [Acidimicrobiales bacterium]|nr:flagellar hook-basal body complex protein FliE [Acidimicrobiales bacterium]
MPIPPIPPISPLPATPPPTATTSTTETSPTDDSFATVLGNALDSVQQAQNTAAAAEAQAAAGQGSLTDTMIAASKASLDTQVTTSLMDKGLAAYTSIADMTL